jgi:hypothetical protein
MEWVMSLETIYYLGQTIAVVAILGSLLFVAYQTNQTNRLARTELTRSLLAESRSFGDALAASAEMSDFVFEARSAQDALAPNQFFRYAMYLASWFTVVESAFRVDKQGLMDDGVYDHIRITTKVMDGPNLRIWWKMAKSSYPSDFVADMDQLLDALDQEAEVRKRKIQIPVVP